LTDREQTLQSSRPDVWKPGSILIERYEYLTANDKPRAQWCVHRVEGDGTLSQLMVKDSRRDALRWAAEHV